MMREPVPPQPAFFVVPSVAALVTGSAVAVTPGVIGMAMAPAVERKTPQAARMAVVFSFIRRAPVLAFRSGPRLRRGPAAIDLIPKRERFPDLTLEG